MRIAHAEQKLMHITMKLIGQNINSARRSRNYTLKKLSRLTGITIENLDRYELGRAINIEIPVLMRISTALDINLEKLMANL